MGMLDKYDAQIYKRIRENDQQYAGNIILNLTGCRFCEAIGIDNCEKKESCTEYIDNFLREYGCAKTQACDQLEKYKNMHKAIEQRIKEIKSSADYPHNFKGQMVEDFEWVLNQIN